MTSVRPHFAYVMYWGALEPVGQATAVPTVLEMARHARLTLLSFEKAEDWGDTGLAGRTRRRLDDAGVRWLPLRYRPGYRATPGDALVGLRRLAKLHRLEPIDAILGRTWVGGAVAAAARRRHGIPYVYHTEGCWLLEQVDQGRIREGSFLERALASVERWVARGASSVVALTDRGAVLARERLRLRPDQQVAVVPTTSVLVDEAPLPGPSPVFPPGAPIRMLYAGSVTGRYRVDAVLAFAAEVVRRRPGSTLRLLTHRDRELACAMAGQRGLGSVTTVASVPHDRMPEELASADLGFFFLSPGASEPCVSPTKIPEYLAHGVPVVCTRASGDGAGMVEAGRAGVVIADPDHAGEREAALGSLDRLLQDPGRGVRAGTVAHGRYSLTGAVDAQLRALHAARGVERP